MPITPDTKDWTWVLERLCPECKWDASAIEVHEVADLVRELAGRWERVLLDRDDVRTRPSDDVWSPLEYGCHIRDVFGLYDHRARLMLDEDEPSYPNWDQDETAVEQNYDTQDPAEVAPALVAAGAQLAATFESVGVDQWQRTGSRSDGARFTIESLAKYLVHDPVHHLYDVGVPYARQ